jgi:transposase
LDLYLAGGVAGLKELPYQGQRSQLYDHQAEIITAIVAQPPATIKEAQATIKEVTGLDRSLTHVSAFLKKTRLSAAK